MKITYRISHFIDHLYDRIASAIDDNDLPTLIHPAITLLIQIHKQLITTLIEINCLSFIIINLVPIFV